MFTALHIYGMFLALTHAPLLAQQLPGNGSRATRQISLGLPSLALPRSSRRIACLDRWKPRMAAMTEQISPDFPSPVQP